MLDNVCRLDSHLFRCRDNVFFFKLLSNPGTVQLNITMTLYYINLLAAHSGSTVGCKHNADTSSLCEVYMSRSCSEAVA